MAEESQSWPLAPNRIHHRSDEENPAFKAIRKERSNKCFIYVFATIVALGLVLLVFSLIVLRPKSPDVKIRSVTVKSLHYATSPWPSVNATLVAELSIKNPNFGPYSFDASSARILYGGQKIGERRFTKGRTATKGTSRFSVTMDVRSSRLPEGANNMTSDLNNGVFKISSYARISGKVQLIKIINNRKTREMKCSMTLVLKTKRIKDLRC
ncbi:late embryogenesis abundant protein At1g64065-like [Humulus lupulus]|uniref:late embryogenesis abundant protein At1g64065-like n=1 Tax=Humulus lupulus TaxID=3486 RepID=UPI002B4033CD|nr:late embryogenesis abundant protein At1g64065-like [Humulus lupulus]